MDDHDLADADKHQVVDLFVDNRDVCIFTDARELDTKLTIGIQETFTVYLDVPSIGLDDF